MTHRLDCLENINSRVCETAICTVSIYVTIVDSSKMKTMRNRKFKCAIPTVDWRSKRKHDPSSSGVDDIQDVMNVLDGACRESEAPTIRRYDSGEMKGRILGIPFVSDGLKLYTKAILKCMANGRNIP